MGCCHAEGKNDGYQALDHGTAPSPPNVVKQQAGETCPKKAADSIGCRPERGDERVGVDVFGKSRRPQRLGESTRVRSGEN